MIVKKSKLRSDRWFDRKDETGSRNRSVLGTLGFDLERIAGRPVIGICNPMSDLNNCEVHLGDIAAAVKRGVSEAGGIPLEFSSMPLGAELLKPSDLPYRNLVSMEIEETLRAYPIDGVALLCNCDKTIPAQLMAAASADIPAIQLNGGPKAAGYWRNEAISSGTDFWRYWDSFRAGAMSAAEWQQLEGCLSCSSGACNEMGTASTMAAMSEALGMMPSATSTIPAHDSRRLQAAEGAGRRLVEMVEESLRPSRILTPKSFENAIRVLMAIGGSTNAVIHLIAIAGRRRIKLSSGLFNEISATTPMIVNLKPAGEYLLADLHRAGGIPAVMKQVESLLDLTCPRVSGRTLGETLRGADCCDSDVIRPPANPIHERDSIVFLKGNLVPSGAVLKAAAASPELYHHCGRAVVFDSYCDMLERIDSPALEVTAESVLVLRNVGPRGQPGMPEWGAIPIPKKLLAKNVRDMVRISDARMSGTHFGAVVLHATPESALGGPLAVVRDGDTIRLDLAARKLDLEISEAELKGRLSEWKPPRPSHHRGYMRLFSDHVLGADEGCDLDFLRPQSDEALEFVEPVVGRS